MPETKHTPGPWQIWTSNSWRRIGSNATGRTVVEPITQNDGHPDLHFSNGGFEGLDARLIAAAPELYEALKDVVNYFWGTDPPALEEGDVQQLVEAAIRKADAGEVADAP